ncbi:hypothetical protein [Streptomyces sp. KL116D]
MSSAPTWPREKADKGKYAELEVRSLTGTEPTSDSLLRPAVDRW